MSNELKIWNGLVINDSVIITGITDNSGLTNESNQLPTTNAVKSYIDNLSNGKLSLSGGTLTGILTGTSLLLNDTLYISGLTSGVTNKIIYYDTSTKLLTYDDIGISSQWTTTGTSIFYSGGSTYIGYSSDPTSGNMLAVNGNTYISGNTYLNGKLYTSGLTQSPTNSIVYYDNITSELTWGTKPESSFSSITYNIVYNPEISTPGTYTINITTTDIYYVNISGNTQTSIIFDFSNPIIGKSLTMIVTNSGLSNLTECVFSPTTCKRFGFYDATKTNAISVLCVSTTETIKYWVIIANT